MQPRDDQAIEIEMLKALVDIFQDQTQQLHEMKVQAEAQRDDLKNALIAIRDEAIKGTCWDWCAANGLIPPAEFQVHGMPHFVAREALRRVEGVKDTKR